MSASYCKCVHDFAHRCLYSVHRGLCIQFPDASLYKHIAHEEKRACTCTHTIMMCVYFVLYADEGALDTV